MKISVEDSTLLEVRTILSKVLNPEISYTQNSEQSMLSEAYSKAHDGIEESFRLICGMITKYADEIS